MAKRKLSYENSIKQIETIIQKIENEELDIDQLAENVKKVTELINFCREKLRSTEEEVELILKKIEK